VVPGVEAAGHCGDGALVVGSGPGAGVGAGAGSPSQLPNMVCKISQIYIKLHPLKAYTMFMSSTGL